MPDDFFAAEPLKQLRDPTATQKVACVWMIFFAIAAASRDQLLSPLHGAAKMCPRRRILLLETAETHLHHRNSAHGEARRFFTSGDEIAPATLPAISGRASPDRIA